MMKQINFRRRQSQLSPIQKATLRNVAFIVSFCLFCSLLNSEIWEIKQDGSGDFTTVQQGIDAAVNGDTVLVYPGTYYENLVILEKAITLGSLYLTTGDEFYVPYTILDGDQSSSVIRIEDTPVYPIMLISGFVIQNGIGYRYGGDNDRSGGGIYALNANIVIENSLFQHNFANERGGGLYIGETNVTINKCIIENNNSDHAGGGISLLWSYLNLLASTIRFNEANEIGGGIAMAQSSFIDFSTEHLNSIYLNYSGSGNDISLGPDTFYQEIIVDTFTVYNPEAQYFVFDTECNLSPSNIYSINIQHSYVDQVDQDVFVSSDGDDNNSGISPLEPLKTITYAMVKINADSLQQRTVHVADGVYSVSQNDQIWPIQVKSYIDIVGESMENTILDAEHQEGFFFSRSAQKNYKIKNFSLLHNRDLVNVYTYLNTNVYLQNLYVDDGFCQSLFSFCSDVTMENVTQLNTTGGGVYFDSGQVTGVFNMINCTIINNYGNIPILLMQGAGPSSDSLIINIINSEVTDNLEIGSEWSPRTCAIKLDWGSKLNLVNSTIGNNESLHNGAAIQLADESEANIINSIVYGNEPYNLCLNGAFGPTTLTTYNSLIEGGEYGQLIMGNNTINWQGETMLDEDPRWLGAGYDHPYALSIASPCIDAGTFNLPYGVELPAYDLAGNPRVMGSNIDMGAYEYPDNAAPIYLEVNNATLSWQMPAGFSPTEYNIYLDDVYLATQSVSANSYTFSDLTIGEDYKAGISAVYGYEETAVIPKYFTYEPVTVSDEQLPNSDEIMTNYPNPFNPSTTISFSLTTESTENTEIVIYNLKGQKVKTLVCIDCFDAASSQITHSITWNGRDDNNRPVSSGIYFYQLQIDGRPVASRKMLLVK